MKNKNIILSLIILTVVTSLSMWPALDNGFTNWDDSLHVVENKYIQELSVSNFKTIFTQYIAGNYYPMTMMSYALEYPFAGLDPYLYHLDNLILHILNTLLAYWLIFLLTGNGISAFVAAILFGIHPVHVEPVAWVSSRKDVLYGFFYLGSLISYHFYLKRDQHKKLLFFLTWLLFCFSILSKPVAASLVFLLFVFDFYHKRKWEARVFLEKLPFLAVTIILGIAAIIVQIFINVGNSFNAYGALDRFLFVCYGLIAPLIKFVLPIRLSNFYPYSPSNDGMLPFIYKMSPLIVAGLVWVVTKTLRYTKDILFGALFFLVTIFFVLRFYPVGGFVIADRYSYIPYLGLCFIVAQGASHLWRKGRLRKFLLGVFISVVALLSVLSWQRVHVWKDSITLWSNVIDQYPKLVMAYQSRANANYVLGKYEQALMDYNRVLELRDNYERAYNGRGKVYSQLGNFDLAIADFSRAIALKNDYANAYNNRGAQYYTIEKYELSLADIQKALEIEPDLPQAYANRGEVYAELEKYDLAEADFEKALSLGLKSGEVYSGRGVVYLRTQRFDQAISDFTKTLSIAPNDADALYFRGTAYALKGENDLSLKDLSRVIGLNNQYLEAYFNRGSVYKRLKQYDQAVDDYTRALIINPQYIRAYLKRSEVYAMQSKLQEAMGDLEDILKIDPNNKEAISRLEMLKEELEK